MRSGKAAEAILRDCWLETTELGPYSFPPDSVDWQQVLACDRVYTLLMIRVATYGEREDLEVRCPSCGHKFIWDLPLTELPVRELPDGSREKIAAGDNCFETSLEDGRKVWFRLMDGRDQLRAIKLIRESNSDLVVGALKARVIEIEDVPKADTSKAISQMSMGEVQDLLDEMDAVDGGIETIFDVFCPSCSHEWEIDLPLDLARMFTPQRPNARRRQRRIKGAHTLPSNGQ